MSPRLPESPIMKPSAEQTNRIACLLQDLHMDVAEGLGIMDIGELTEKQENLVHKDALDAADMFLRDEDRNLDISAMFPTFCDV